MYSGGELGVRRYSDVFGKQIRYSDLSVRLLLCTSVL